MYFINHGNGAWYVHIFVNIKFVGPQKNAKIRFNPFEGTCGHGASCSADVAANMTGGTAAISVVKCLLDPKFRRVCNTPLFSIFHNKKASRVTSEPGTVKNFFRYNYLLGKDTRTL